MPHTAPYTNASLVTEILNYWYQLHKHMKKVNKEVVGETIAVAVSRLGQDVVPVVLPKDATVRDALSKAGVSTTSATEYFVSGQPAEMDDILDNGDVLALVTPKQAGI